MTVSIQQMNDFATVSFYGILSLGYLYCYAAREAWTLIWSPSQSVAWKLFYSCIVIFQIGCFFCQKKAFLMFDFTVYFNYPSVLPALGSSVSNDRDGKTIQLRPRDFILNLQRVLHLFKNSSNHYNCQVTSIWPTPIMSVRSENLS